MNLLKVYKPNGTSKAEKVNSGSLHFFSKILCTVPSSSQLGSKNTPRTEKIKLGCSIHLGKSRVFLGRQPILHFFRLWHTSEDSNYEKNEAKRIQQIPNVFKINSVKKVKFCILFFFKKKKKKKKKGN